MRCDLNIHHRFEQRWSYFLHCCTKCFSTRGSERVFIRVNRMIRTVDQLYFEIHQRITRNGSRLSGFDDAFFNRRSKLLGNRTTEYLVLEDKASSTWKRFKNTLAIAKLSTSASLLFVASLH